MAYFNTRKKIVSVQSASPSTIVASTLLEDSSYALDSILDQYSSLTLQEKRWFFTRSCNPVKLPLDDNTKPELVELCSLYDAYIEKHGILPPTNEDFKPTRITDEIKHRYFVQLYTFLRLSDPVQRERFEKEFSSGEPLAGVEQYERLNDELSRFLLGAASSPELEKLLHYYSSRMEMPNPILDPEKGDVNREKVNQGPFTVKEQAVEFVFKDYKEKHADEDGNGGDPLEFMESHDSFVKRASKRFKDYLENIQNGDPDYIIAVWYAIYSIKHVFDMLEGLSAEDAVSLAICIRKTAEFNKEFETHIDFFNIEKFQQAANEVNTVLHEQSPKFETNDAVREAWELVAVLPSTLMFTLSDAVVSYTLKNQLNNVKGISEFMEVQDKYSQLMGDISKNLIKGSKWFLFSHGINYLREHANATTKTNMNEFVNTSTSNRYFEVAQGVAKEEQKHVLESILKLMDSFFGQLSKKNRDKVLSMFTLFRNGESLNRFKGPIKPFVEFCERHKELDAEALADGAAQKPFSGKDIIFFLGSILENVNDFIKGSAKSNHVKFNYQLVDFFKFIIKKFPNSAIHADYACKQYSGQSFDGYFLHGSTKRAATGAKSLTDSGYRLASMFLLVPQEIKEKIVAILEGILQNNRMSNLESLYNGKNSKLNSDPNACDIARRFIFTSNSIREKMLTDKGLEALGLSIKAADITSSLALAIPSLTKSVGAIASIYNFLGVKGVANLFDELIAADNFEEAQKLVQHAVAWNKRFDSDGCFDSELVFYTHYSRQIPAPQKTEEKVTAFASYLCRTQTIEQLSIFLQKLYPYCLDERTPIYQVLFENIMSQSNCLDLEYKVFVDFLNNRAIGKGSFFMKTFLKVTTPRNLAFILWTIDLKDDLDRVARHMCAEYDGYKLATCIHAMVKSFGADSGGLGGIKQHSRVFNAVKAILDSIKDPEIMSIVLGELAEQALLVDVLEAVDIQRFNNTKFLRELFRYLESKDYALGLSLVIKKITEHVWEQFSRLSTCTDNDAIKIIGYINAMFAHLENEEMPEQFIHSMANRVQRMNDKTFLKTMGHIEELDQNVTQYFLAESKRRRALKQEARKQAWAAKKASITLRFDTGNK